MSAAAPPVFLCQVCDQTPERGHAPDCPGAQDQIVGAPFVVIAVPVRLLDRLEEMEDYYHDKGPDGEGWDSNELMELKGILRRARETVTP